MISNTFVLPPTIQSYWYACDMTFDSRTEIIYAVLQTIAEEGISGLSMRNVAAEAGVSLGRVQHHFRSKDELLVETCRALVAAAEHRYNEQAGTACEQLEYAIGHVIPRDDNARRGAAIWSAFVAYGLVEPTISAIITDAKRGQEAEVARLMAQAGFSDAGTRARALIALADGLVQRVLTGDLSATQAQIVVDSYIASHH